MLLGKVFAIYQGCNDCVGHEWIWFGTSGLIFHGLVADIIFLDCSGEDLN